MRKAEKLEVRTLSKKKTVNQLQEEVDTYISQFKEGYFSPLAMMARMTEELGELAREVNHYYGEKPKKASENEKEIKEELGDLLFVLICFANSLGIDLEEAHDTVMKKYNSRDKDRWTRIDSEGKGNKK
ncbi:nucleotide pyrophosphohydrolase [Bacillus massilinigeriensis]|uniref:nucleotide pyrophosphohydrolase n=1 Tax=Bacillus mediterraneensis TaxID=1805474 RepID=UPI0008F8E4AB|nr:nucleotide pyrophosphohydrolase [Bacillus mediterraneensis]